MADYQPTIGLEIHAELATRTKMFCACPNEPDEERPNWNICPVCLAHPGTLPVINQEAVRQVLRVGVALGGKLALEFSEFDRKNYFYPDIPKGYQISQYKFPLVSGGVLNGVKITRVHLEEDTATSRHENGYSLIDFNRAGVPLMELVTEPVITSARQAGAFARELQLLLRYLGASAANMEKGEMRVEANISLAPAVSLKTDREGNLTETTGVRLLGTKVEVKNLNSFRAVEKAIEYELKRQQEVLEAGEKVIQETRGWDDAKQATFSQRKKESSHDYRYFPEPDLPKLKLGAVAEFSVANLTATLPELPWAKRERYRRDYGIKDGDIEIFVGRPELANFFEQTAKPLTNDKELVKLAANYITNDLIKLLSAGRDQADDEVSWQPQLAKLDSFADLIKMVAAGEVSSRGAKDILATMVQTGESAAKIAEAKGLFQKSDTGELEKIIGQVVAANPQVVADYRAGKQAALQFLVGQGMKLSKGAANPTILQRILIEKLK